MHLSGCAIVAITRYFFQDKAKQMLVELREAGIQLPGEKDADEELWDFWLERQKFRNKKDRVMMNRFMACIHRAEKELPFWTIDSFEREYLGLELDMLSGKQIKDKLMAKAKDLDAGESGGTTSTKVLHFEDKTLRSCADNAIILSVALLADYDNKRICETICQTASHLKEWRVTMVKECRSGPGCLNFIKDQCKGGAFKHIIHGFKQLEQPTKLEQMRFTLPSLVGPQWTLMM